LSRLRWRQEFFETAGYSTAPTLHRWNYLAWLPDDFKPVLARPFAHQRNIIQIAAQFAAALMTLRLGIK